MDARGIRKAVVIGGLWVCCAAAMAAERHVPGQYATIQAAIDAAVHGDTVVVAEGDYREAIHFRGKNILVTSTDWAHPEKTSLWLRGTGGSVVTFAGTEGQGCALAGFLIHGGHAPASGGAVLGNGAAGNIVRCVFMNNAAQTAGGAIHGWAGLINGCTFKNNYATYGAALAGCHGRIANCLFIDNRAPHGAALNNCDGTIVNCTFVANRGISEGVIRACDGTIANSILWNNEGEVFSNCTAVVSHCCFPGATGSGNVDAEPLFVAPGDYHLSAASPCLDAGTAEVPGGLTGLDADRLARVVDSDQDGTAAVDLGAYEFDPLGVQLQVGASRIVLAGGDGLEQTPGASFVVCNLDGLGAAWSIDAAGCEWLTVGPSEGVLTNAGDEVAVQADVAGLARGVYTCPLTLTVAGCEATAVVDVELRVAERLRVPQDYPTIQAAVDASHDGGVVEIDDGVWTGPGNRDITFGGKAVTVRGVNGPEHCIIDCQGSAAEPHGGFEIGINDRDVVIEGLSITNAEKRSAISSIGENTSIINCWVYGNRLTGIFCAQNGLIMGCRVFDNVSDSAAAGFYGGWEDPERWMQIVNCVFYNNRQTGSMPWFAGGLLLQGYCHVNHCTIVENSSEAGGGAGISGRGAIYRVRHSILWDNWVGVWRGDGVHVETVGVADLSDSVVHGYQDTVYTPFRNTLLLGYDNIGVNPMLTPDRIHLRAGSACIDAAGSSSTAVDYDGELRPWGGAADIGADEFVDADGDGLPDWFEVRFGGSPTALEPDDDLDDDGLTNIQEYERACDPLVKSTLWVDPVAGDDASSGLAADWDGVDGPKRTIQAAIDACPEYGRVILKPGLYQGDGNRDLSFGGKDIIVRGVDPNDWSVIEATVIDCQGTSQNPHRGFIFESGETSWAVLEGLTITGGYMVGGGAIKVDGASPIIRRCRLVDNVADTGGGAVYCRSDSRPAIEHCRIEDNVASVLGAAILGEGARVILRDSLIRGNRFSGNARENSGILQSLGSASSGFFVIKNCIIKSNGYPSPTSEGLSPYQGYAVIYTPNIGLSLSQSVLMGNHAGTVVRLRNSDSCEIDHCTIAYNRAGGIIGDTYAFSMDHSVFWGNGWPGLAVDLLSSGASINVAYCLIEGGQENTHFWGETTWGPGNIDCDPLLTGDGYHLQAGSPCIDAGDPEFVGMLVDIDGEAPPHGLAVDIGADEFVDSDGDTLPDGWEQRYFGSPTAADPDGNPDNDAYTTGQEYVRASNPVEYSTIWVHPVAGDDEWDGWATEWDGTHGPKRTILAAIEACNRGEVVLLPGVYTGPGNWDIRIDRGPITVRGLDPSNWDIVAQTIIDGQADQGERHRGLILAPLGHFDVEVAGLTVRNMYPPRNDDPYLIAGSGGGMLLFGKALVRRCIITDCKTQEQGGGIYAPAVPLILQCQITGNHARFCGGGVMGGGTFVPTFGPIPRIEGCLIAGNAIDSSGWGAAVDSFGGEIQGSTIVANRDDYRNQQLSEVAFVDNCIIAGISPDDTPASFVKTTYSCVLGRTYGGNIDADPLFIDPGYWDDAGTPEDTSDDVWVPGDYRLQPESPCINAGDPQWQADPGATDIAGQPRVLRGRVDMGAWEAPWPGDSEPDDDVDVDDLLRLAEQWLSEPQEPAAWYTWPRFGLDFNVDGRVDLADLALLAAYWRITP